jgi:plastocyanin
MPRMLFAVLSLLLLVAIACGEDEGEDTEEPAPTATSTAAPPAAAGPTTFTVLAGATDQSIDIEQFMPATIRIREGDTITWQAFGYEGHTVTFIPGGRLNLPSNGYLIPAADEGGALEFNPVFALASEAQESYDGADYTNSGYMGVPAASEYSLTFPRQGVYAYLCMIHPLHMRGVVVVDAVDAEVPSPEAVAEEGERLLARYTEEAQRAAAAVRAEREDAAQRVAAGQAWEVSVGLDTPHSQVLAFMPASLQVEAGDTVIFWNSDRDFHNVIFAPEGTDPPPFPIIKPAAEGQGGFRLIINPEAAEEVPPPDGFGPEAFFSSGLMGITFPRLHYEVTFRQPGTYRYYCTVHTLAGMAGVIEVR